MFKKKLLLSLVFSTLLTNGSPIFAQASAAKSKSLKKTKSAVSQVRAKEKTNPNQISEGVAQNRALLRPTVIEIARDPKNAHQRDAIRLLRDSHDIGDRLLGLTLQLTYFPPAYSTALQQTLKSFNLSHFRENFGQGRDGIDEADKTFQEFKREKLPEYLAALKEMVKDLGKSQDPHVERATLSVLLHSIIHCLTRQTEVITESMNALNRVRAVLDPVTASLTPCVREIVEEAFLQAFQGQGAAKMDQARFVLAAHIGISFDPEKLATLRVGDAEIPGILEAFYKIFTEDFLVTQVCTRLQNQMNQSPQAESRKQRPLNKAV